MRAKDKMDKQKGTEIVLNTNIKKVGRWIQNNNIIFRSKWNMYNTNTNSCERRSLSNWTDLLYIF